MSAASKPSKVGAARAPSSSEEGVGGGGPPRQVMVTRAKEMRGNPTEPERRLWVALRASQLGGHKFRRQAIVTAGRIADFFCPSKGLIVELDGQTHDHDYDKRRDESVLSQSGFPTLRFTNSDVMTNMDGVLAAIEHKLSTLPDRWKVNGTTPYPPPLKRRGK